MSSFNSPGMSAPRGSDHDIYTVLALVGFLFVLTATIYVAYRAQTLCGTILPAGGS